MRPPSSIRSAWATHLREALRDTNVPSERFASHLTESVALYCSQRHPSGLPNDDLNLLLARALCAVGEREAARRILHAMTPHRNHLDRWMEALCELDRFPELLPLFSASALRPAEWEGARRGPSWTLDLNRLRVVESDRHEITLIRTLNALIESISVLWDATRGSGTLAIKGMKRIHPTRAPHGRKRRDSTDLPRHVDALLDRHRRRRGWTTRPDLFMLED